jgi:hypothetical protein
VIAIGAAGYIGYKALQSAVGSAKSKFELKSESMTESKTNPLSTGVSNQINQIAQSGFQEMMNNISPDLEMKSFDSKTGKFSVLYKPTGETLNIDMANGEADLEKFLATIQKAAEAADKTSNTTSSENNTSTETKNDSTPNTVAALMGLSENTSAPAWVPSYPGAKTQDQMNQKVNGMAIGSSTFTTQDEIKKVGEFFESKLKASGFQIESTKEEDGDKINSINLIGQMNEGKKICNVSITAEESTLTVHVSYTEIPQ